MRPEHAPYLSIGATITARATFVEYGRLTWSVVATFEADAATARTRRSI
jgi:hypothetical protein